mgnify:CR=1 FL=1
MILATLFYAGMNVSIKFLDRIPSHEVVFFRSIVTLVITWVLLRRKQVSPWGNNKKLLIARGLAGFVGLILYIYTVQRMSLASAVTIQYLSPIFTALFAIFILGERMKGIQWLFFGLAFIGVVLIKGYDSSVDLVLLLLGVASAVGSGLAYNFIRKLRGQDDPLVIVFYFPLVTLPIITPYTLSHFVMPSGIEWLMLLFTGLFTQFAQVFMTRAYQLEKVANVSLLTYLGTIYALIIGTLIFNEVYQWQAIAGMALIVGGILASILYKRKFDTPS